MSALIVKKHTGMRKTIALSKCSPIYNCGMAIQSLQGMKTLYTHSSGFPFYVACVIINPMAHLVLFSADIAANQSTVCAFRAATHLRRASKLEAKSTDLDVYVYLDLVSNLSPRGTSVQLKGLSL